MKKQEIVTAIMKNVSRLDGTKFKRQEVQDIINYAIELTKQSLRNGDKVVFRSFGTFSVRHRNAKRMLNNKTKEWTMAREKNGVHFLMSKDFDAELNG